MKRGLILLLALISACNAPAASVPTGAPSTAEPTAALTGTPASPPATAVSTVAATIISTVAATAVPTQPTSTTGVHDCGQLTMLGPNPPSEATALDSENCFRQAFEQCTPASLTVTIRGVDAGTSHVFTTAKAANGCAVSDTFQSYIVPLRTPTPLTVQCTSVTTRNGALVISGCNGEEDIVIPAR